MERRTSRESVDPSVSSSWAPFATAVSRSRASARSSSPVSWLVPPKETCWWSMVKCRVSAARLASSAALSGMNRAIASAISRSSAAMPMRCANGATWASTNAAASADRLRVDSAIRRARQASRSPDCTRAQHRGSRYFSSTAAAICARPPSVERPIARANSAMQNSATNGAPSPARVRPVSPPGVIQVAASSMDSGGCCSAQVTAATISTASARIAAALASRATRSTSAEESRSPRSMLGVAVMSEFKHRAPTETGEIRLLWKGILDFPHSGRWFRLASRRAVVGLVCPLASLAARPPVVAADRRVPWFRDARFARSSTTERPPLRSSSTSGTARLNHRAALAPQPPVDMAARTRASKRRWSRPASGCHWTPRQKRLPSASIASRDPSVARAVAT